MTRRISRRQFIAGLGALATVVAAPPSIAGLFSGKRSGHFIITMSDEKWKERLSPTAYKVLRQQGTERPNSSPLNNEKRAGTFYCAGCSWPLFSSANKYDSGSGWPSFWQPMNEKAVGTSTDYKIGYARTEVHCAHCGGHLGHVFPDGPKPTGKRYCINGVAMVFRPGEA